MKLSVVSKFISSLMLSVVLIAALSSCTTQPGSPTTDDIPRVLAAETFLADIAQNVAGTRLKVESLIKLGQDPHAFEPSPQDVVKIANSSLLILNGAGFEEWAAETLENAGGKRAVIEASAGLTSREAREGEAAVMSPEEKAESVCANLAGKTPEEVIAAGGDAAKAVELHAEEKEPAHEGETGEHEQDVELFSLKLNPAEGGYQGYVLFDVAKDGEYVIAANGGTLSVMGADGAEMEVEETLPINCAGLNGGILLDLEPGEYIISLSGLAAETTLFFAGAAGGHHHHVGDPHFWLDPINVVKYVENIRDGLIAADPEGKDTYTLNATAYIAQLNELDAWIKRELTAIPDGRRLIVTNHESFGYFADRYDLRIIGTIIPSVSTGSSPSAQQLARLVDRIRKSGAIAIFLETGSNPKLAEQLARETGIKVVTGLYTHSITEADGNAPTYIDMLKYNVQAIVNALK